MFFDHKVVKVNMKVLETINVFQAGDEVVVEMFGNLIEYLYIVPAALIAIMLHEIAHGLVSYWLGDPTPKRQGRLSLNPLKHLDPVGTICLILFHVGWAKPVVVNPDYYKKRKLGMALVALAGPLTNFIVAIVSMIIIGFILKFANSSLAIFDIINTFLLILAIINIGLGVFNLIPIPPLDGSKILGSFLKGQVYEQYMKYQQYGFIILALLLFLSSLAGGGVSFISIAVDYITNFFLKIVYIIFGLA